MFGRADEPQCAHTPQCSDIKSPQDIAQLGSQLGANVQVDRWALLTSFMGFELRICSGTCTRGLARGLAILFRSLICQFVWGVSVTQDLYVSWTGAEGASAQANCSYLAIWSNYLALLVKRGLDFHHVELSNHQ